MSLILEALRKSEAERRRGSTPDVAMELPPAPAARARATPAWVLPASLVAVVALLAGAWWSQRDSGGDLAAPIAASSIAEPGVIAPAPPVVVARAVTPPAPPPASTARPATQSATAPVPAIAEPAPPPVRALPLPPPMPAETREVADIDTTPLPPVKLSMHMWDESPSRRFVILDGQRMTEGDRNGELTVVAIERDGVVVERNGQRARVPLP